MWVNLSVCVLSKACSALVVPPRHHPFNLTQSSGLSFGVMLGRAQSTMAPTVWISQLGGHCPPAPGPNYTHRPGACDQRPSGLTQPRYRGLALGEGWVQKQRGMLLITLLSLLSMSHPLGAPLVFLLGCLRLFVSVWTPCVDSSGYSESVRKQCTVTG